MIGLTAAFDRSRQFAPHVQNRIEADKRRQRQFIQNQDDRQKREERLERAEDDFTALAGAVETAMASAEPIASFEANLTTYDTAVIEALMENEWARDLVQEKIDAMLERAYVMEDGRRAFRTEDGLQVFDQMGNEVTDEVDPAAISEAGRSWESFSALKEESANLEAERASILEYQGKLDEAREAVASGEISETDLTELETDLLRETMPDTVRTQIPEGHPAAQVEQAAEQTATVQTLSLDGLQGFSMPLLGG